MPKSYYVTAQRACLAQFLEEELVRGFENTSTLPPTRKVVLLANMGTSAPLEEITASLNRQAPIPQNLHKVIYHIWLLILRTYTKSVFAYRCLMLGMEISQNLPILPLHISMA